MVNRKLGALLAPIIGFFSVSFVPRNAEAAVGENSGVVAIIQAVSVDQRQQEAQINPPGGVEDSAEDQPATKRSPLDWVPPQKSAEWAPRTTENLAIVRRLAPGLRGRELEEAQFSVAVDMALLASLVGRDEASIVERQWERRVAAMYDSRHDDLKLKRQGITRSNIEGYFQQTGRPVTAMQVITLAISYRHELEEEMAKATDKKKIANYRDKLRQLAEDTRYIWGETASNVILTKNEDDLARLRKSIVDLGNEAAARAR